MKLTLEEFFKINATRESLTAWLKEKGIKGWPFADINWRAETVYFHI